MSTWPETKALSEANITDLEARIDAANTSVVNGKQDIYDAIVTKAVTPAGQTFSELEAAILLIRLGQGNAIQNDVVAGKTFTNSDGIEYTGTLTLTGSALASNVLATKTFYSTNPQAQQTGTMPNRAGDTAAIASSISGTTLKLRASDGYRDGVDDNVTITDADFVASNIKTGITLFELLGTLSSVKTIQRGTVTGSLSDSNNVTISSVDVTKSVIIVKTRGEISNIQYRFLNCRASITSATNINFSFDATPGSSGPIIDWIVIEFDNVKSKQTGSATISADTNVTISSVNIAKSLAFVSFSNASSANADVRGTMINGVLTSGTNLLLLNPSTYVSVTNSINWQVIEFN